MLRFLVLPGLAISQTVNCAAGGSEKNGHDVFLDFQDQKTRKQQAYFQIFPELRRFPEMKNPRISIQFGFSMVGIRILNYLVWSQNFSEI